MSEYMDNQFEYESRVEWLNIIILSIYTVCLAYIFTQKGWNIWGCFLLFAGMSVCWSLYLTKTKTFRFRAAVTAVAMQAGVVIDSVMSGELMGILPVLVACVILIGLYELPDLTLMCTVVTFFLYAYHIFFIKSIPFSSLDENIRLIARLSSVFLAEYGTYYIVSNQKEGRRRQNAFIEELKEAEQSRDDFLANVSHELRTPINTICGMSEMALREPLSDKVRQEVYHIQTSGRNLLSVVSDILDFSELQAGEVEIVEETYNITSTINDVINMSMARKNEKDIELVVDCDASMPGSLVGDEQKIRRVIMNFVNNAIKYTQEGCVMIEVGYRRESYGINLTVGVKDTGIGMLQADIEKLFTGFGQIETKRNRRESGIGLGLAISSAIIDSMGGFISVQSEYGKGTYMQFSIPQKVLDWTPIASIDAPDQLCVAVYIDMEQFELAEIRDAYASNIRHMVRQLGVECYVCRKLAELKRRTQRMQFTHIFISMAEYQEDKQFFHQLAERTHVIIVIDRWQERYVESPQILRLYKPFFVLPVTMFLNNHLVESDSARNTFHHERFTAENAHVLVVDDNYMNIKVAEGMLKPYKIHVTMAMSGREALEKLKKREHNYDFVFMDHMMPEMDGIECLEHIRELPGSYYKNLPVIALTANAIGGTREMFLEKGFADFVAKPIEISVLERVLRRNLPKEKLQFCPKEQEQEAGQEGALTIGDLDTVQGELFCGGRENYLEILKLQAEDQTVLSQLEEYYETEDWKNYTILVHGVKSTMKSIGAQPLSDLAKALEAAGKREDLDYIRAHQEELAEAYIKIRKDIELFFADIGTKEEEQPAPSLLPEIAETEFEDLAAEFENAVYALDGAAMLSCLESLGGYQYHGRALKDELEAIQKKVERSDYMSALSALLQVRERLMQL